MASLSSNREAQFESEDPVPDAQKIRKTGPTSKQVGAPGISLEEKSVARKLLEKRRAQGADSR